MSFTTLASPPEVPAFQIVVLEGPLANTVLQRRGTDPPGTITLTGRSLPYRPISWEGRQRVETVWYPGNTSATQQVMGPVEEPTTINGVWKDKFLGDGQAQNLVAIFDTIRRAGPLLDVLWGPFVRQGIMTRFKATPDRLQDIAWECEFTWRSQGELVAPPTFSAAVQNPRENLQAVYDTMRSLNDSADASYPNTVYLGQAALMFVDGKFQSIVDVINSGAGQLSVLINTLDTAAAIATNASEVPRNIIERGIQLSLKAVSTAKNLSNALDVITSNLSNVFDDAQHLLDYYSNMFDVKASSNDAQEVGATSANSLTGLLYPDVIAVERPSPGSDLRDLAVRYYGDADLWWVIAQHNNIPTSRVPDLPVGPSDLPPRGIEVPKRPTGTLAGFDC